MNPKRPPTGATIAGATLLALTLAAAAGPAAPVAPAARAPEIVSDTWINSPPQTLASLKGRVVLVEFWTFACQNCRNVEPYVKRWHERYAEKGLFVIGVHSPEFPNEADVGNVRRYVQEHEIRHAIALDNDFANWKRYGNRYWPALYLIDKQGFIRYVTVGEGGYDLTETRLKELLAASAE